MKIRFFILPIGLTIVELTVPKSLEAAFSPVETQSKKTMAFLTLNHADNYPNPPENFYEISRSIIEYAIISGYRIIHSNKASKDTYITRIQSLISPVFMKTRLNVTVFQGNTIISSNTKDISEIKIVRDVLELLRNYKFPNKKESPTVQIYIGPNFDENTSYFKKNVSEEMKPIYESVKKDARRDIQAEFLKRAFSDPSKKYETGITFLPSEDDLSDLNLKNYKVKADFIIKINPTNRPSNGRGGAVPIHVEYIEIKDTKTGKEFIAYYSSNDNPSKVEFNQATLDFIYKIIQREHKANKHSIKDKSPKKMTLDEWLKKNSIKQKKF